MNWIPLIIAISVFSVVLVFVIIYSKKKTTTTVQSASVSPVPEEPDSETTPTIKVLKSGSPIPVGVKPNFTSIKTLVSTDQTKTFNYVNSPLQSGSSGYIVYGNENNMFDWGFSLPLQFTHAKMSGKIFEFENANSSDTHGVFVGTYGNKMKTPPSNFFSDRIELGTFF